MLAARDREEFLAIAGHAMRHVLVDHARTRLRAKREGGFKRVPLEDVLGSLSEAQAQEVVEVDEALKRLTEANPRAAYVVQQRIFAGQSVGDIDSWLKVSEKTVSRDWTVAIAWLRKEVRAAVELLA